MGRTSNLVIHPELAVVLRRIGKNIRIFRKSKGLSQAALAEGSRISITTINEIETVQFRDIRISTLSAIAGYLEIPVAQIFRGGSARGGES